MAIKHLLNLAPITSEKLVALPILVLYITDGCNSRCQTCDIWRSPRRNMNMELVESLAEDAAELGVRWVALSGGEAMQHPDWPEIAKRFRKIGARVMLLTNGLLMRKQWSAVVNSVDEVIVSLDAGTAPTYKQIRGVDGFEPVIDGIKTLRRAGATVSTRTTVQRANFREIPEIIRVAKAADVNQISFLTVDVSSPFAFGPRFASAIPLDEAPLEVVPRLDHHAPSALTVEDCAELDLILNEVERTFAVDFAAGRMAESPAKLRRMSAYFRALIGQYEADPHVREVAAFPPVRCNAPQTTVVVEVDGRIRPCYFLPTMGRVRLSDNTRLTEAMNSDEALSLRREQRRGLRAECGRCVCPLYKGPRALLAL